MQANELKQFVTDKVDELKASDIVTLDVRDKSCITDFLVLCTGNSRRHVASIAEHVCEQAQAVDIDSLGTEGQDDSEWVVVDLGDVMVHVMQKEQRQLYQLEKLWN
ncbi:ribosome silencing factor [Salinivibrio kushneri]|uniref:ribosome silencing factor n=1 Tax=Salinivibrio kushneri TaxID=1908198 RepID=UPI000988E20D|nr:ribosome silencing factor [Salinivibrio kushneri]OOE71101.1 ribosome silencing factor [Salinivibrio kushneri]